MSDTMPAALEAPLLARDMLVRTWALLDSLTPSLRDRVGYPLDSQERVDWDFIPKPDRTGLSMMHLTTHQKTLMQLLLRTGLSESGYSKVLAISAMENILRDREADLFGLAVGDFRHQDNYFFSVFGRPGFDETWAWRFLGHHVSLSFTVIEQRYVVPTPLNMGSQPAGAGVLSPLAGEEQLAFDLLSSMDADQSARTRICPVAPPDYVTRQVPLVGAEELPDFIDLGMPQYRIGQRDREALRYRIDQRAGLLASQLRPEQQELLVNLVTEYVSRLHPDLAAAYLEYIGPLDGDDVSFVWAGGDAPHTSHYYRIETPGHVIEFCNAIDDGNHIHSVLRDLQHDLGFPALPVPAISAGLPDGLRTRLVSSVPRSTAERD